MNPSQIETIQEAKKVDDIHITFPTDSKASTLPIIFVLGWAGSKLRALSKYGHIFEDCGCVTVLYSAPVEEILFYPEKILTTAKKLLDLVTKLSLQTSPIIFYCFSNGGSTVYQFMIEAVRNDDKYIRFEDRILCQVFDSGPGRRTSKSFLGAVSYIWPSSNPVSRYIVPRLMLIFVLIITFFKRFIASVTGKTLPWSCYKYIQEKGFLCPAMFIYSKSDKLFPFEDIEDLAAAKERGGCEVLKVCFDDSPHVNHLRTHREIYINSIQKFFQKCLQDLGNSK